MATNSLGGVLLPSDLQPTIPPTPSSAVRGLSALFEGISNAFVGTIADLYVPSRGPARRDRQLYLALLFIVVLLLGNIVLS